MLKRDDLNVDEIEIWESLLKWCFSQHDMKDDLTKWNREILQRLRGYCTDLFL